MTREEQLAVIHRLYEDWEKYEAPKEAEKRKRLLHYLRKQADAHQRVQIATIRGELVRPKTCSRCGREGKIHGHHADYTKPLEVEWLCMKCHSREHSRLRKLGLDIPV